MPLQVLSGKVTPEVAEQFRTAQENSEAQTFNAFFEILLEAYLNPKPKLIPKAAEDQERDLQLKENRIGELMSAYSLIEEKNTDLQAEIMQLSQKVQEFENRQPEPTSGIQLAPGEIIVKVEPIISRVAQIESEIAKKKTGQDFSVSDILVQNFWTSIRKGVTYPFRIWSEAELAKLAAEIKAQQKQPNE